MEEYKGFQYVYSAEEQEELKSIRDKYTDTPKEESKIDRVRRLDKKVGEKAQIVALVFGIIGALIFGAGMSIIMTEIGAFLETMVIRIVVGVGLGIIGGALAGVAYPMYKYTLKKEKKKVAPEIIKLTDELIK